MKKIATILFLALLIVSCGGGGDDDPTPPVVIVENKAPSIPVLASPANGVLCIDNTVNFAWNSSVDPESDNISYEIKVAENSQFSQGIQTKTTTALTSSFTLNKGLPYYWKVKAIDSKNKASDFTSQWGFYTEGIGTTNYVPFAATLVKINVDKTSITIEWVATDLNNDQLNYDIYLQTSSTLNTPIVLGHTSKTYTKTGLISNTIYYCRIDVKDSYGAKTIGQVWNFKTE